MHADIISVGLVALLRFPQKISLFPIGAGLKELLCFIPSSPPRSWHYIAVILGLLINAVFLLAARYLASGVYLVGVPLLSGIMKISRNTGSAEEHNRVSHNYLCIQKMMVSIISCRSMDMISNYDS